jgi:hypothetical protein
MKKGISCLWMLAEFHDFEDEALNNGGFLEDICHMTNNNIVLSVGSDDLVELEFGGWCRTKGFPSR